MNRFSPRPIVVYLVLLFGALVAASRPVQAIEPVSHGATAGVVAGPVRDHRPALQVAPLPFNHHGPSWHRVVGRRLPRSLGGHALPSAAAGSIPTALTLYSQRLEWHVLPVPAVHGAGGLAAPPRAPPR